MKSTIVVFIIIVSAFSLKAIQAQDNINRLSLEDVLYIARQQSPDALIAKHRFRASYWQYRSYKASYLPMVRVSAELPTYNRVFGKEWNSELGEFEFVPQQNATYSIGASIQQRIGFTGGSLFIRSELERLDNIGQDTTTIQYRSIPINIGYSQPLFQYNAYKWEKKIEPLKYQIAERTYLEDVEQISITATNYFFNLLLAQLEIKISKKNFSNYDTLYQIAKGRYNLGKIAENELLQLELNLLQAEASLDNAQLNFEDRLFRLKSFLRIKDDARIELIPPTQTFHGNILLDEAIGYAKTNTSIGLGFEERILEAKSRLNQAKTDGRFDADIYAVFGLTQSNSDFDQVYVDPQDQQQFSLGFTMPILDWGVAKGNIKMQESNLELVMTDVEQDVIDFEQSVFLEVMQFNMQKKQLYIAAKADTVAQKRFDVTQQRYLIGKINDVLELDKAQIDNDNARKSYYQSLRDYWVNYFNLRKMTLYDFEKQSPLLFDIKQMGI